MKSIDIKSLLIGIFMTSTLFLGLGAAGDKPAAHSRAALRERLDRERRERISEAKAAAKAKAAAEAKAAVPADGLIQWRNAQARAFSEAKLGGKANPIHVVIDSAP